MFFLNFAINMGPGEMTKLGLERLTIEPIKGRRFVDVLRS